MGSDLTGFAGLKPEPAVAREDAFEKRLLAFYEDEIGLGGFVGMDLSVGYSYDDLMERPMGNFRGVASFYNVLAELSGAPGDSLDPSYRGPFRKLFQAREWVGPIDCVAIAGLLEQLNGQWSKRKLAKHDWKEADFAEYFEQWRALFAFTGSSGAVKIPLERKLIHLQE